MSGILYNVIYSLHRGGDGFVRNRLKIARVSMDLTQQQLADKVGVTRQTISLIEKGTYNPTLKLCLQICYVLNKTLDDLFWVDEEDFEREKN